MTDHPQPAEAHRRNEKRWAWFAGLLTALMALGFAVAIVAMLPLAMATDGCHDGSSDSVCQLSAFGQNILVLIPWMCLVAGVIASVVGAWACERRGRTPLIGLAAGVVGYMAMIPAGYGIAFLG